jgi:hypothetical protein
LIFKTAQKKPAEGGVVFTKNQIVLVDTNAVLEAHRVGCWNPETGKGTHKTPNQRHAFSFSAHHHMLRHDFQINIHRTLLLAFSKY